MGSLRALYVDLVCTSLVLTMLPFLLITSVLGAAADKCMRPDSFPERLVQSMQALMDRFD